MTGRRAMPAVTSSSVASRIRRLCESVLRRSQSAAPKSTGNTAIVASGIARNASGSSGPGAVRPSRVRVIATYAPSTIINAPSTAPATPRRRCTAVLFAAISDVCATSSTIQVENAKPCTSTEGVSSRPPNAPRR